MSEQDYRLNVQSRLGCDIAPDSLACRQCGETMDTSVGHASCCARAESTKGHYGVCRALAEGLRLADSGVVMEARGITSTSQRPADIYSNAAVPNCSAALDVNVVSQDAIGLGQDHCRAAYRRKVEKYRRSGVLQELAQQSISFRPMVWSTEGRPHPAVLRVMAFAAEVAARHQWPARAADIRRRWKHEVMVALLRRKAAMIRACLPAPDAKLSFLAH
eukprot:7839180-Karenia_brevis.AAC.1